MSLNCKARLFGNGNNEEEIRRFKVDQDVAANFEYLKSKIVAVFPSIQDENFKVFWKDEEGDLIHFSSDEELVDGLAQTRSSGDLFNITIKKIHKQQLPSATLSPPDGHLESFSKNPTQDQRHAENWRNQPMALGFSTWPGNMTDPRFGFHDPFAMYHYPWQYGRFPAPQTWHTPPVRSVGPRNQLYVGDERFGAAGFKGPRSSYYSSWMSPDATDGNVQVQQQSQSTETHNTSN